MAATFDGEQYFVFPNTDGNYVFQNEVFVHKSSNYQLIRVKSDPAGTMHAAYLGFNDAAARGP
jgi:hypothetical protein